DFLVDRHECSALRQFPEFLERRQLHRRVRSAASITPAGGRSPVHHSNCCPACAASIGSPSSVAQPARCASASSGGALRPYVRSYTSRPSNGPPGKGDSPCRPAPPSGVQFTSRSHERGAGGHAPTVPPRSA